MNALSWVRRAVFAILIAFATLSQVSACPFCNAVTPTFAERRESAAVCALLEADSLVGDRWRFKVHRSHKGEEHVQSGDTLEFKPGVTLASGDLVLGLGTPEDAKESLAAWRWEAVKVSPKSYLYFAKTPDMRQPSAERMAYFVPYLENEETDIAADAFAEIGRAPLEAVEAVSHGEVLPRARMWLADPNVPNERKGGYGLMLGLAPEEQTKNAAVLRAEIDAEREDFRAGFDGILAGYLLLKPNEALKLIDDRYLDNADARPGDTRHAIAALRFCLEYARGPERADVLAALEHLLARKSFAPDIIPDLARWKDWTPLETIAALYDPGESADPQLNRAVVGYLKACPEEKAQAALDRLREQNPAAFQKTERALALPINRAN